MPSPTITLLTDFGTADVLAGILKGVIRRFCPAAEIVDLSHEVPAFDAAEAALLLHQAYSWFPGDTVHVVVVDPGVGGYRRIIAAEAGGFKFVAPDTGLLAPTLAELSAPLVVAVEYDKYFLPQVSHTFHGRDIFAPVAAHLAAGVPLAALGPVASDWQRLALPAPEVRGGVIHGEVLRVDRFGNLITNIPVALLSGTERPRMTVAIGNECVHGLQRSYDAVRPGRLLALIGSTGHLEIACHRGHAAELLGLGRGAAVTVRPGIKAG